MKVRICTSQVEASAGWQQYHEPDTEGKQRCLALHVAVAFNVDKLGMINVMCR